MFTMSGDVRPLTGGGQNPNVQSPASNSLLQPMDVLFPDLDLLLKLINMYDIQLAYRREEIWPLFDLEVKRIAT